MSIQTSFKHAPGVSAGPWADVWWGLWVQDRGFIQGVMDAQNLPLLRALAESPRFDVRGCAPHGVLHCVDRPLLEALLRGGLDINARLPGTKTFLLHKVW